LADADKLRGIHFEKRGALELAAGRDKAVGDLIKLGVVGGDVTVKEPPCCGNLIFGLFQLGLQQFDVVVRGDLWRVLCVPNKSVQGGR